MLKDIQNLIFGDSEKFSLEHRCYKGVCLTAGLGCMVATIFNSAVGMGLPATLATFIIGSIYLWLYFKGRRSESYQPNLWLYIIIGSMLLVFTWFFNGGLNGSITFVSMVALVAMTVVLRSNRMLVVGTVFFPIMTALFLLGYFYPESITAYTSEKQRFFDVYLTFVISTIVISTIISLILENNLNEKNRLDEANHLLEEKMDTLHQTNVNLEKALTDVQTLSGLLPICSSCKKIRDDKGYWNQIEAYIQRHSYAEFSHSLCPDCAGKLYPDFELKKDGT